MVINDIRICFIGDSFVNGTGDEHALGWSGRLCVSANRELENSITYYNLGIRRNTSLDILNRIEFEIPSRLPTTIDSRVVVSFGVNDTAMENGTTRISESDSIENFIKIVNFIQPNYELIIIGPPAVNNEEHNIRIHSLNAEIKSKAKDLNVPYIELFSELIDDKNYKKEIFENDGAHPRKNGYENLSKIIEKPEDWWF
ncbi:MAG: hypothetical protein JKY50_06635 [Oleispira sp.]|nr:hypothetical protein [Oleispira sp.]MBL4881365.1 hypothetical protein [Oleispira sp.]